MARISLSYTIVVTIILFLVGVLLLIKQKKSLLIRFKVVWIVSSEK
jgi:hypothetical protein